MANDYILWVRLYLHSVLETNQFIYSSVGGPQKVSEQLRASCLKLGKQRYLSVFF